MATANSAGIVYETFLVFQDTPRSESLISDDVLEVDITRELATFNRTLRAGNASFTLFNSDGRYSPRRSDSPFGLGALRPNLGIRFQSIVSSGSPFILDTSELDGTDVLADAIRLFTGFIDDINIQPALNGPQNAIFRCRDNLKEMVRRRVTTDILTNVNVTSAFTTVLSLAGITADQRSIAPINETRNFIWYKDIQLLNALDELVASGAYNIFVSGDGVVSVRDRDFEFGQGIVASYENLRSMSFSISEREIMNDVQVRGFPRAVANSIQVVANIVESILLPSSSSVGFFLDYLDPRNQEPTAAINMQTPVSSQDFLVFTNSDGTGTNRTAQTDVSIVFFGETAVQTITNLASGDVFLTKYQLRGDPILRFPSISVRRQSTVSQSRFGIKEFTLENRLLAKRSEIADLAGFLVDVYKDPTDEVSFSLVNRYPDILTNELSDIVRLVNDHTGVDAEFTIKGLNHRLQADQVGWVHEVNYDVLQSLAFDTFILDSSESGILDTNRLARDPDPMPSTLLNGLRAYWKLDVASNVWIDSDQQNHLTSVNSVEAVAGQINSAALFNASSQQYLTHPDDINLRATTTSSGFSISGWAWLNNKDDDKHVINKHYAGSPLRVFLLDDSDYGVLDQNTLSNDPDSTGEYYLAYVNQIDRYVFGVTDNNGKPQMVVADNFGSPGLSMFRNLQVWYDPTSQAIAISVDNGVANTRVVSAGINRTIDRDFYIGANSQPFISGTLIDRGDEAIVDREGSFILTTEASNTDGFLDGRVDEVGVWQRVLTPTERSALFNGGVGLTYPFIT